jgi:VanZ family protein
MALIFYFSEEPPATGPLWAQILAHFTEFAVLASLLAWALAPALGRRAFVVAAAVAVLYAIADEFHQSFVPGRDADPLDVLVDWAGVTVAVTLARSRAQARGRPSTVRTHSSSR